MAEPKQRLTRRRRNQRRSHDAISVVQSNKCPQCKAITRHHYVCKKCGYYDGQQIVKS